MSEQSSVGLLVVDIQGKLAELVDQSEAVLSSTKKLIKCCSVLSIPIVVLEQNPEGLGLTHKTLTTDLGDFDPLVKFCFNGLDEAHIVEQLKQSNIQQWLVVGIEAHICVYQTALGLMSHGFDVQVLADCISSRKRENVDLAIDNLRAQGATISSVEMFVYQHLGSSRSPHFKKVLEIIK